MNLTQQCNNFDRPLLNETRKPELLRFSHDRGTYNLTAGQIDGVSSVQLFGYLFPPKPFQALNVRYNMRGAVRIPATQPDQHTSHLYELHESDPTRHCRVHSWRYQRQRYMSFWPVLALLHGCCPILEQLWRVG